MSVLTVESLKERLQGIDNQIVQTKAAISSLEEQLKAYKSNEQQLFGAHSILTTLIKEQETSSQNHNALDLEAQENAN